MAETTEIRTQLRLPADLYGRVTEAAAASGRSMNAEIVQRLETSFLMDKRSAFEMLKKAIDLIESSKASLNAHEGDIAKFMAGDRGALGWLYHRDDQASDEEIIDTARKFAEVFEDEITKAKNYVPLLISVAKNGGPIPEEVRLFLSRA